MATQQEIIARLKEQIKNLKNQLKRTRSLSDAYANHYHASQEALEQFKSGMQVTQDSAPQIDALSKQVSKLKDKNEKLLEKQKKDAENLRLAHTALVDINDLCFAVMRKTPAEFDYILRAIIMTNTTALDWTGFENGTKNR